MARRKEVFQSKVLQKLYPAAPKPKPEKEPSPVRIVDALSRKPYVKIKASQQDTGDAETTHCAANPGRRMYTVLPPPADYKTETQKSITPLESINSAEDPAEENIHDDDEELDQDKEEAEQKRKRRRRKRKPVLHQDSKKDGAAPLSESSTGPSQKPVDDEGGEFISRNKKRKLKKKRHKEKLLAMGLMPRATALEFTYRKHGEEEEEEEEEENNERRTAEVSDFLRKTMEIYMSDSSLHVDKVPVLTGTVNDLLSGLANGSQPTSVLKQLHSLKAFVQQKQTDKLEKALEELSNTSTMSAEETTAVVSLFQYWITDVLPMQGDEKFSTMHPRDSESHRTTETPLKD